MFVETLEVDAGTGRSIRSVYALDNGLTLPEKPLNETAFCDWIARARVGQAIQYHEGFLMLDRAEATSDLPAKDRTRLHAVARRAWIACELGLIHLFSQRVGDGHYRYFAVRSSTPLQSPDFRTRLRVSTFNPHA
ncbi:MAG: hypothetical protein RLZZ09_1214 [Pseudomonadota bacterium]|jgi:hypothetical protein